MVAPCDASMSRPAAQARAMHGQCSRRQVVVRAWRVPSQLERLPSSMQQQQRVLSRRHHHHRQQLTLAAAAAEDAELALLEAATAKPAYSRPGYRSFVLDTCEFLVAESPDGALDLSDVYWVPLGGEEGEPQAERPECVGDIPAGPRHYQSVEVGSEFLGNVLEDKPAKRWVFQVYFIPVASLDPYQLDLESGVFVLEHKSRTLTRSPIVRLAPPDTPPHDLRLRIRKGTLTLEAAESLPGWEEVVLAHQAGLSAVSEAEADMMRAAEAGQLSWDEVQAVVGPDVVRRWQADMAKEAAAHDAAASSMLAAAAAAAAAAAPEEIPQFGPDSLHDTLDENLRDFIADYDEEEEGDEYDDDFDSGGGDF